MKITIEQALDDARIARFYAFYRAAFEPMKTRAAARHTLSVDEFIDEMRDRRIDKYIAWNESGEAVGVATMTTDLTVLPWIEPAFHAARHPEQVARKALYYLGNILVDPAGDGIGVVKALGDTVVQVVADDRGVMAFDVSAYKAERAIGRMVSQLPAGHGATVQVVDTQSYFTADFDPPQP
jgi:hypothetical protein